MIEISRNLARRLFKVLRLTFRNSNRAASPVLQFVTSASGLQVRGTDGESAVQFQQGGSFPAARVTLPIESLKAFAGADESLVALQNGTNDQVVARWNDRGVPQVTAFAVPDAINIPAFPEMPERWAGNPNALAVAIDAAARTTSADAVRYALQRIQLRGRTGEVVATDGKQMLKIGGFDFGFENDVLVPRLWALGGTELAQAEIVAVGRTDSHVCIRCGAWTFALTIDNAGRYPDVDVVIPKPSAIKTTCKLGRQDTEFLLHALPRLPGQKEQYRPVTLDLNGNVTLRARSSDQPQVTEVVLSRSHTEGLNARVNVNGEHLLRAVQLGFHELSVVDPDRPIVCRDNRRVYLTMPLTAKDAIEPGDNPLRLDSATSIQPRKLFKPKREKHTMTMPSSNGSTAPNTPQRPRMTNPTSDKNRIGLSALLKMRKR